LGEKLFKKKGTPGFSPWGGGGGAAAMESCQPYNLHVPIVYNFWEPQSPRAARAYPGL